MLVKKRVDLDHRDSHNHVQALFPSSLAPLQLPAAERDYGGGGGDGLAERAGDDGDDGERAGPRLRRRRPPGAKR